MIEISILASLITLRFFGACVVGLSPPEGFDCGAALSGR